MLICLVSGHFGGVSVLAPRNMFTVGENPRMLLLRRREYILEKFQMASDGECYCLFNLF